MSENFEHQREVAASDIMSAWPAFRPPRRVSVSEGASENLIIKQTGGPAINWSADETPYMVEPTDMLASRKHEAVCFVGPARTGKTASLIMGWMAHAIVNDPGDMLIVSMTQDKARELSKTDIDRALRHSPNLKALQSASSQDDTVHDKQFKHGMWLRIGWPTVPNLSGSTYRYVAFTDLDRMPDDVGGEGAPFPLGLKRTTTFMSRGMAMAESSPGRDLVNPNWSPNTPHEAPPTNGILGLYNTGDRRRWHWKCFDCRAWFEAKPGLDLFHLPADEELRRLVIEDSVDTLATKYSRIVCPHCDAEIAHKHKAELNRRSLGLGWFPDHCTRDTDNVMIGEAPSSSVASYWLGGVAAAFQPWRSLVLRYLTALRQYELSGDEEPLKNTTNVDQGMPYMPRYLVEAKHHGTDPSDRKDDTLERYVCPDWTRFLIATVDVQGGATTSRFVVQVHAHGAHGERTIVDRFDLRESMREGMGGMAPIDPTSHGEDWDVLTERVVRSTYRTGIEGRELAVMLTVVDTGGEHKGKGDGVSDKAYAWYRRLRRERMHGKVMLVKGSSNPLSGSPIKETLVGARSTREKGDVPLYILDTNKLKDRVDKSMRRTDPGANYTHLPAWLPKPWFDELSAEVRGPDGKWKQIRARNESLDLLAYDEAGYLRLGADKIANWDNAPPWARTVLDVNSEIVTREERREMQSNVRIAQAEPVSQAPRPAERPARQRRTSRSGYLG